MEDDDTPMTHNQLSREYEIRSVVQCTFDTAFDKHSNKLERAYV